MSNTSSNINNIVVTDRLVLNHIWPNVLARYWQRCDEGDCVRCLYDILKYDLNIQNVTEVYRDEQGNVVPSPAGTYDPTSAHIVSTVGEEVLVTLQAIDNDITYNTGDLFKPVNGYEHLFGKLHVKIPPVNSLYHMFNAENTANNNQSQADIIANFQLLGFYFPLSQLFDDYDTKNRPATPSFCNENAGKTDAELAQNCATNIIDSLSCAIISWYLFTYDTSSNEPFIKGLKAEVLNLLSAQHKKAGEQPNSVGQLFDRGGAFAFTEDANWEYFVPRMVAYNWNSRWQKATIRFSNSLTGEKTFKTIKATLQDSKTIVEAQEKIRSELKQGISKEHIYREFVHHFPQLQTDIADTLKTAGLEKIINENFKNTITGGDQLSSYPEMLETLGYTIPPGLKIYIHYAAELPKSGERWHPAEYASELEVVLPSPPEILDVGASAIADFTALRASQPFTVG
ncbi:hypothetical protein [Pseudoalteromonas sp. MMG012]|uniref:hypothetical protein n=1 Tax=Pseudoalteromonas sp. MMG012 TaxID=2822686 RepID=UPI001B39CE69|nr:hypothetical protein [Pseudoalteromonas sp. MMG012]MBQ4849534.1 hypothetical protein [Pseudoalteromonas sp. MMG012]